ncbi:MAG: hypothetical protein M3O09_12570 [Acidobacteriota bacterium]|nr:hypothetical protein [Acidobacteriota bacterium]
MTLTATPASGYSFSGWGGACNGTATCVVTISTATAVSANFAQTGSLTVSLSGVGSGSVTSNPSGISCPGACSARFGNATQVNLIATPAANNSFGGWGGGCSGTGLCSVSVSSSSASSVTASFGLTLQSAVNHIIFLVQENRSFDSYFGALRPYWAAHNISDQPFDGLPQFNPGASTPPAVPGCDPTKPYPAFSVCVPDATNPVSSYHLQTMCVENPSPSWNESHVDWNYNDPTGATSPTAALNGFVKTAADDARQISPPFTDTNGVRAMGYYDGGDLNYYYFMASNFATSDRWFSPVMSRTNPNREYLISGTSFGFAYPNGTNAQDNFQIPSPIIFEKLQGAGITWRVYVHPDPKAATYGSLNCAANDTTPQCLYQISYLHNFTYGQTIINQYPQNIAPIAQFYSDAAAGTLPQVVQIEPASNAGLDEHAADFDPTTQNPTPCCSVQAGAAYVKSLMDAVMGTPGNPSPSWKDSVFILTYDEFGGFYDHVQPQPTISPDLRKPVDLFSGDVCTLTTGPLCDFTYTGYRVPLIVVSPFTKRNYVSHSVADYTAILKLIESRFNLSPLTNRDAAQIDMSQGTTSFFDFVNEPWKVPPSPPSQSVSGPCYLDHLP